MTVRPVGPAAHTWVRVLRRMGLSYMMLPRRPSEYDKAFYGARWAEAQEWINRVTEAAMASHPELRRDEIDSIAAAAYSYAADPDYPDNDRDALFSTMIAGYRRSQRIVP